MPHLTHHPVNNATTFTIFNHDCSVEFAEEIVDYLISIPRLCDAFKRRLFVQSDPKDIFILALTQLRDTGDIDCLVRALNWQQNTIDSLSYDVERFNKSLLQLDVYRQKCARLQHSVTTLRHRNAELIRALQESRTPIPKRNKHENKKKDSISSR